MVLEDFPYGSVCSVKRLKRGPGMNVTRRSYYNLRVLISIPKAVMFKAAEF